MKKNKDNKDGGAIGDMVVTEGSSEDMASAID